MKSIFVYFSGLVIISGMLLLNWYVFSRFFSLNYFEWFLKNGTIISIITSLVAIIKTEDLLGGKDEKKKDVGLISDHPVDFLGAHFQRLGLYFDVLAITFSGVKPHKPHLKIDFFITSLLLLVLVIVQLIWFLVVIPAQYVIYFFCGAPSRIFNTSEATAQVSAFRPSKINQSKENSRTFIIDIKEKPIEFTNAIAAVFLFIINQIIFQ